MAELVELEEVCLHAVIFKMGGDDVAVRIVGRVLHGAEIRDVLILRDDDEAARVLAGRVWGDGKTPPPYGKLYFFRCGACAVALCVSLLLDCFVVPGLVSSLAGTFLSL